MWIMGKRAGLMPSFQLKITLERLSPPVWRYWWEDPFSLTLCDLTNINNRLALRAET
jgi:hypothetical protein